MTSIWKWFGNNTCGQRTADEVNNLNSVLSLSQAVFPFDRSIHSVLPSGLGLFATSHSLAFERTYEGICAFSRLQSSWFAQDTSWIHFSRLRFLSCIRLFENPTYHHRVWSILGMFRSSCRLKISSFVFELFFWSNRLCFLSFFFLIL